MPTVESPAESACLIREFDGIRLVQAVAAPAAGPDLETQTRDALRVLDAAVRSESAQARAVQQTIFLAEEAHRARCEPVVRAWYGDDVPATTFVVQKPACGADLAIELWSAAPGRDPVQIDRIGEHVVRVIHQNLTWIHCAGVEPRPGTTGVYNQTISSLSRMRALLARAGVGFDQILRTWLYLGGIVEPEGDTQRYKELNRARTGFFEGVEFLAECGPPGPRVSSVYPASTGIGTSDRGLTLACIALDTKRADVHAVPLENPRQTSAFDYGRTYSPKSPKFARAMALACGDDVQVFISGTASITHSESRHLADVQRQTHETIDNIAALISRENLARHGLRVGESSLGNLAVARAYIKRPGDYETVRAVCEERFGRVPMTYLIADVCRPELLVEIEGMSFARGG